MKQLTVGIDIGNVIIGGDGPEDTSFFSDNFLRTPMIKDAFDSIATIASTSDVWLISKCGEKVQAKTLAWLEDRDFFAITGVNPEQVIFCKTRPEKAGIAERLGLDVFIDDRTDIIDSMKGIVAQPILFTSWDKVKINLVAWF